MGLGEQQKPVNAHSDRSPRGGLRQEVRDGENIILFTQNRLALFHKKRHPLLTTVYTRQELGHVASTAVSSTAVFLTHGALIAGVNNPKRLGRRGGLELITSLPVHLSAVGKRNSPL